MFSRKRILGVLYLMLSTSVGMTLSQHVLSEDNLSEDIPRLANGKPDFNGVWQVLNTANYNIEPHAASAAMVLKAGPYGDLPDDEVVKLGAVGSVPAGIGVVNEIPYQEWARKQRDENQKNWLNRDPEIKCYLPGVPRATYMPFPFQIIQSAEAFFIAYEYAGATRNIFLKDPGPAPIDSWMGQSYGEWENDTFVIHVTGNNDQTWFDRAGNFHSDALKVEERYHFVHANLIRYEATITDEKVFTQPWTMRMNLYRRQAEDAQLLQFKCVEFVEELIYGHLRRKRD
jgi:hypothetical protein